jgi:hypothetical protein
VSNNPTDRGKRSGCRRSSRRRLRDGDGDAGAAVAVDVLAAGAVLLLPLGKVGGVDRPLERGDARLVARPRPRRGAQVQQRVAKAVLVAVCGRDVARRAAALAEQLPRRVLTRRLPARASVCAARYSAATSVGRPGRFFASASAATAAAEAAGAPTTRAPSTLAPDMLATADVSRQRDSRHDIGRDVHARRLALCEGARRTRSRAHADVLVGAPASAPPRPGPARLRRSARSHGAVRRECQHEAEQVDGVDRRQAVYRSENRIGYRIGN